jgi:ribose-phosphate pyrophosphokinase
MKVIDSDDYAASGIKTFFFPGGEPHAQLPENKFGDALVFLKARTWNDVGIAACVMSALMEQGNQVWLFAGYFPGARQDRTDFRTPITKEMIGRFLGSYCNRFYTFDMHSRLAVKGLHVERNFMPSDLYSLNKWRPMPGWIICPDKGAVDRCKDLAKVALVNPNNIIYCEKRRDFKTGDITGFDMEPLREESSYLVVDDICDGGRTFNLIADAFVKDRHAAKSTLTLYVSHGIFSKGIYAISETYGDIITTDSWCRKPWDSELPSILGEKRLDVVSLQPVLDKILEDVNV